MVAHGTGLIAHHAAIAPVFCTVQVLMFADTASGLIIQVSCRQKQTAFTAS